MSNWRTIYIANTLIRKYGVVGKVASRYVLAGFSVRVNGKYVYAKKEGSNLVIGVATNEAEAKSLINELVSIAKKLNSTPVLAIFGRADISKEFIDEITKEGVKVKFVRELD